MYIYVFQNLIELPVACDMYTHMHVYICTHMHIHLYMSTRTRIHTHTLSDISIACTLTHNSLFPDLRHTHSLYNNLKCHL